MKGPWRRPENGDTQAILARLTRIEESVARVELATSKLEDTDGIRTRLQANERKAASLAKDINKHAGYIMELRQKKSA